MKMTEKRDGFRLIGLKLPGKTTNQNNQSAEDCGHLWQTFEKENIFGQVPGKLSQEIYAVYFDYEKDEHAPFSYFIGCKTDQTTDIPSGSGLDELVIPAQEYTIVTAKGVMTACITDAWKEIWASDIPRAFEYDFEIYDERSQDWNNAELDIFVSVTG